MKSVSIINHSGATSLLSQPVAEGGKNFPFLFQAVNPKERRWAYRLLPPLDPLHLTGVELVRIFQQVRTTLRANWEEQDGHPVGFITIYLPATDGSSEGREARFELGPELGPDMKPFKPKHPHPEFNPGKAKKPTEEQDEQPGPSMEDDFGLLP
jgi:hypothetical protein